MTGHIGEEQLALYAFGDVAAEEGVAIEAHVECCAECQGVLEQFRLTREFVGSALQDPALDDLVAVRAGIRTKLGTRPEKRAVWWLAGAAAAAVALLLPAVHRGPHLAPTGRTELVVAQPMVSRTAEDSVRISVAKPRLVARVRHRAEGRARLRTVTLMAGAEQPATIKMKTGDPNVVILWQLSEGEENR